MRSLLHAALIRLPRLDDFVFVTTTDVCLVDFIAISTTHTRTHIILIVFTEVEPRHIRPPGNSRNRRT